MGQKSATRQLQQSNVGDTRIKKYYGSNMNTATSTGNYLICDIHMPVTTIYKGAVLVGHWTGGGGNTAINQHYVQNFVAQVYPYTPTYLIYQDRAISNMRLKIWQNNSNSSLFRLTIDCLSNYKSFSYEFWQHRVNDYYSNPKGIREGDPRTVVDMTGWTLRQTGL